MFYCEWILGIWSCIIHYGNFFIYLYFQPLDRDPPDGKPQWHFKVEASDGQFNTTTDVVVNLKDVNDNVPFFPEEVVNTTITENTNKGKYRFDFHCSCKTHKLVFEFSSNCQCTVVVIWVAPTSQKSIILGWPMTRWHTHLSNLH